MSLIRWNPNWDPFRQMDEMMSRLPSVMNVGGMMPANFSPALDMYEEEGSVIVKAQLPEINPNDVEVTVQDGTLTIKGETKREHEVEEKNFYRKEMRSGSFHRQVPLPATVKEEEVSAEFSEGILKITMPIEQKQTGKKINVKIIKKDK